MVDFARVAAAYAQDVEAAGGVIATGAGVRAAAAAGREHHGRARAWHHRGRLRGELRRRLVGPARRDGGCAGRAADRSLPRRLPASPPRAARAGPRQHLSGSGPGPPLPRRAPDADDRRRGAARPLGADGRRPRRLPDRAAARAGSPLQPHLARHLAPGRPLLALRPHRDPPRGKQARVRLGRAPLRPRARHRRRAAGTVRDPSPGARPRRSPRRRLRRASDRAGAARPQRALPGGNLVAGAGEADRRRDIRRPRPPRLSSC